MDANEFREYIASTRAKAYEIWEMLDVMLKDLDHQIYSNNIQEIAKLQKELNNHDRLSANETRTR